MMSLIHSTTIFMLITINKSRSYYIVYTSIVISFLPMIQDAPPPVISMNILNDSISKFVSYVEFAKALYLSTLTRLHGYF